MKTAQVSLNQPRSKVFLRQRSKGKKKPNAPPRYRKDTEKCEPGDLLKFVPDDQDKAIMAMAEARESVISDAKKASKKGGRAK